MLDIFGAGPGASARRASRLIVRLSRDPRRSAARAIVISPSAHCGERDIAAKARIAFLGRIAAHLVSAVGGFLSLSDSHTPYWRILDLRAVRASPVDSEERALRATISYYAV